MKIRFPYLGQMGENLKLYERAKNVSVGKSESVSVTVSTQRTALRLSGEQIDRL